MEVCGLFWTTVVFMLLHVTAALVLVVAMPDVAQREVGAAHALPLQTVAAVPVWLAQLRW